MKIHCNDIDTHIETHNYDSTANSFFFTTPKNEEELTRTIYSGRGEELECRLCCVDYEKSDKLVYLACSHFYHESCIIEWINKKKKEKSEPACPVCHHAIFK